MTNLSIKLPMSYSESEGHYESNKNIVEQIEQNLLDLFYTEKGERYVELDYGIGIYSYLFEPFEARTRVDLSDKIQSQIGTYMPYIEITRLVLNEGNSNSGATQIFVDMDYIITPLGVENKLELEVS